LPWVLTRGNKGLKVNLFGASFWIKTVTKSIINLDFLNACLSADTAFALSLSA
jgi:hypothetical protein